MELPNVSLVVPTFRRPAALAQTLNALLDVDYPRAQLEIVVVDDGSRDDTEKVVAAVVEARDAGDIVRFIDQPNRGAATARNRGAKEATGTILIFIDDDILVAPDHINRHLDALAIDETAIVNGHWDFAPEVLDELRRTPFGRFRLQVEQWVKRGIVKRERDDGRLEPAGVTACNMGIRRDHFWSVGGFDESFPMAGYEDQEFSYRARQEGSLLLYDHRIRLLHNDQRLSLDQFCLRQEQGATTAVYLARKYPAEFADHPLIKENSPIGAGEPARLIAKKVAKRAMSTRAGRSALHGVIRVGERIAVSDKLLDRCYWIMCGVYIYMGVREGLARTDAGS